MALIIDFKMIPMILIFLSCTCQLGQAQAVVGGLDAWRLDGICDVSQCNDPTICTKSADDITCKCRMGLYNAQCDKDARITVKCDAVQMTLSAAEAYFQYYNTLMTSMHYKGATGACTTTMEREEGVHETMWVARMPKAEYADCGGTMPLEKNVTHVVYSMMLQSQPQSSRNIIRDPIIQIEFKCIYQYHRMASLPFALVPYIRHAVMRIDDIDATIKMSLFQDETYTHKYTDDSTPSIELLDTVYVEVKVTNPEDFFNLRLNDCWATQTPEQDATEPGDQSHRLLHQGCVTDETDETFRFVPPDLSVYQRGEPLNGKGSVVRFAFQMFRFNTEPYHLYLRCSLVICEDDVDHRDDCTPICPPPVAPAAEVASEVAEEEGRKKRDLSLPGLNEGLVVYGPIKMTFPRTAEASGVMKMVALPVAGIWAVGLVLVLLIAVAKAGNRRLQRAQEYH